MVQMRPVTIILTCKNKNKKNNVFIVIILLVLFFRQRMENASLTVSVKRVLQVLG